jgi:hypothetical protein
MIKKIIIGLAVLAGVGCTDAEFDSYRQYGASAEMKCFSGETLIVHVQSTGKILNEQNSDGYRARWKVIYLNDSMSPWQGVKVGDTLPGGLSGNCLKFYTDLKE